MINQHGLSKIGSVPESIIKIGEITLDHVLNIWSSKLPNSSYLFLSQDRGEKRETKSLGFGDHDPLFIKLYNFTYFQFGPSTNRNMCSLHINLTLLKISIGLTQNQIDHF